MGKKIRTNFIYNLLLTIVTIGFPLITAPYVSRVLGVENIGISAFVTSFSNIFLILAALGIPMYGIREIAKAKENREELSKVYNSLLIMNFIASVFYSLIYLVLLFLIPALQKYFIYLLLYSVLIITSCFSIDWFFQGIEEFRFIAVRTVIIRGIGIAALFLFVKTKEDLLIYIIINIAITLLNNIINTVTSKRFADFKPLKVNFIKTLFNLKFFYLQAIVGCIYQYVDQVILGAYSEMQLGYYSRSKMIALMLVAVSNTFSRTVYPRLSNLIHQDVEEYKKIVSKSFSVFLFLSTLIVACLISYSDIIILFIGGNEFMPAVPVLMIMSALVFSSSYSVFLDTNISAVNKKEHNTLISNIFVAVVLLTLNLIFISSLGSIGAALAIVAAETVGFIVMRCLIYKQKLFVPKMITVNNIKIILCCLIFLGATMLSKNIFNNYYLNILVSFSIGISAFLAALFILSRIFKQENELLVLLNFKRRISNEKSDADNEH